MSLITTSVANLVGGVSQQPSALRLPNQCERQENAVASAFEGLIKRPPAEHVAVLKTSAGADIAYDSAYSHIIDRDASEQYTVILGKSGANAYIEVYDINGVRKTVTAPDGYSYINETDIGSKLRVVTIADVTFVVNREKTVATLATLSPKSRDTATTIPEAMVWIRETNYKRRFEIKITKGGTTKTYYHNTGSGTSEDIGTATIASLLATSTTNNATTKGYASDPFSGLTLAVSGNIIWAYGSTSSDTFDISVSDDFGGSSMKLVTTVATSFNDLPDAAPHHYLCKIIGSAESGADDYWVRFVQTLNTTSTTSIGHGYWEEGMAPGLAYKLDPSTMPHILIRNSDGTFTFKKADGTTYADYIWDDRLVGDNESNPLPSFVGNKIRDLNFFKDRLVLLSGEYAHLSEVGQYFNFFLTTIQNVVDSDPIEVGSTQAKISDMKSSAVFSDRLVIFTPQTQLTLKGENILSARTVSLTPSAAYENTDCQPVTSGTSIFFAFNRGSYAGVREMFISNSLDVQFDATDLTVQVPQYLSGKIVKIAASTHENFLVTLCSGERSSLFVYKYYNQGDQRIQSAWCKFTFRDAYILDMQFLDTVLYIVMKRGSSTVIEKIRLESGLKDTNSTYVTTLDRRLDQSGVAATYNSGTGLTTYTLPYTITTNASMAVVTKTGLSLATTKASSTTLTVPGNYTTNVWIGDKYTMVYQFSEPTLKTPVQTGGIATIAAGRYQLRYGTISYGNSAFFQVKVQVDAGSTFTYDFTGRNVGDINNLIGSVTIASGDFRFPVYSRNTQVKISVENDSPLPSNLLSAEYEALFSERSTRR